DPPDAAEQRSPERLYFSYVAGPESRADWEDFASHLAQGTGKPVEIVTYESSGDQLGALADAKLHVAGFNTGTVPAAVTSCGFVPVCTFGHEDGSFGITMQFIVPSNSKARKIDDLKGGSITFTSRDSNSGCKAALALLQE